MVGRRGRCHEPVRRAVAIALAVAFGATACRSSDDSTLVAPASTADPVSSSTVADAATTSTTAATATTVEGTADSSDPPATTSSIAPPTTQPAPLSERVDSLCSVLRTAGFETRATAVADFETLAATLGESTAAAEQRAAACPEALDRFEAAAALRDQRDRLDATDDPVTLSGFRCADGEYRFIATNNVDHPIGVHVALRLFGPDDELLGTADYPIVIWELEPEARQGITGTYTDPGVEGFRCNLLARTFVAGGEADATVTDEGDPALSGDDPNDWFGALLGREVDAVGSGDVDAAAVTEDLRSTFYDDVFELNTGSEPVDRVPTSVTICNGTVDRPGDDRVSFVYFVTYPTPDGEEGLLRHGLFRRGSDGQWRWLSAAHTFDSPDFHGCGRPGPQ